MAEVDIDKQLEKVINEAAEIKSFCLIVASSTLQEGKLVASMKNLDSAVSITRMEPEEFVFGTRKLISEGYIVGGPKRYEFEITQKGIALLSNVFINEERLGPDDGDSL